MPGGRAVLLFRRLSTGDNKLKNFNINQGTFSHKESIVLHPVGLNKDFCSSQRLTTFGHSLCYIPLKRSFSDNTIKMSTASADEKKEEKPKFTNRLISEKSPYLLQHAHNPVDWYPWCTEAFEKAKRENKVIFLSIGYSTCHWCHVMEKESFQNEDVASFMNQHFVNIKVDREERPDLDRVYMLFITLTNSTGGWPMSLFLTPELVPITGATYFPPEDRWGRQGFKSALLSIVEKWEECHVEYSSANSDVLETLQRISLFETESSPIPREATWIKCVHRYMSVFEPRFGGFSFAPKFPQASILNFLFHYYARDKYDAQGKKCLDMCLYTLIKIARGGIHDHVSGGFARYSVDNEWHVPHFEKMLYDQAQLMVAYTDAYLATKDEFFANIARGIIKYLNRDLRNESGGYYSAEDADSYPYHGAPHKKEGAFYVWEYGQLKSLLDHKKVNSISYFDIFCHYFNVDKRGNVAPESDPHGELRNKNVLIIYGTKEEAKSKFGLTSEQFDEVISDCLNTLYEERQKRPRPLLDTKMLCSWNGLVIAGLAQAGQGLGEKSYVDDAIKTANFIKKHLYNPTEKILLHCCYRAEDGSVTQIDEPIQGFLDDYAFFIKGLLDLYEASLDVSWLNWARELQNKQNELFWDNEHGGYFNCSDHDKSVVLRLKDDHDGAEPSGNSVSCHNLQRLAAYADKSAAPQGGIPERKMAERLLMTFSMKMDQSPTARPEMISTLMFYRDSPTQVLISGGREDPRTLELLRVVRSRLLPGRVLAVCDPAADSSAGMSEILLSRIRQSGEAPAAYVCRRYACSLPVTDVKELETLLDQPPARSAPPPPMNYRY